MTNARIMIVEDEGILGLDLKTRLEGMGYEVLGIVHSGEEAIQQAEETHPDLVLMDIHLEGEMDGVEAAEQIRKGFYIPVIFLTAHSDDHTFQRAKVTDPFGYLLKPVHQKDLYIAVEIALCRHETEKTKTRLEEQLRQAQKMEAIGQLTEGVAHHFNNMLQGIMANHELALTEAPEPIKSFLDDAHSTAERAAQMIKQLMVFSHSRESMISMPVEIDAVIHNTVESCRKTFDPKVDIVVEIPEEPPVISGNPAHLEQVILNLLLNSRDALESRGNSSPCIQIEADILFCHEEDLAGCPGTRPGGYIRIQVSDNGEGMDRKTTQRVIEPFFTTRKVGKGTGLGLAVTYAIIRQHRGWIEVESELGVGTTFSVYLPTIGPGAGVKES